MNVHFQEQNKNIKVFVTPIELSVSFLENVINGREILIK